MTQGLKATALADLESIQELYRKYGADLARVREEQSAFYRESGYLPTTQPSLSARIESSLLRAASYVRKRALLKPQLDDLEAEITYLRLRESKPETVVEISPCGGWSTTWILRALRDNGRGKLYSYDLVDTAARNVPRALAEDRWVFTQGDATRDAALPAKIDYLFIDSDHSAQFAQWYITTLFPRLSPGTPVSVHDVFHTPEPSGFDGEGGVIIDWLEKQGIPYFTASGARAPQDNQALWSLKRELGMDARIHRSDFNSMIFFHAAQ